MTGERVEHGVTDGLGPGAGPGVASPARKVVLGILTLLLLVTSGVSFHRHRTMEEPVVLSAGVT